MDFKFTEYLLNDLLRDLIKIGDITAFIDDIMVETGMEEECDNIVEECDNIVEEIFKINSKEWFICETREICIKDKRLWVFGSGNKTRWSKDGEREDSRSSELTSTKGSKGCAEVFGVGKLL